jgi:hypothetical protein
VCYRCPTKRNHRIVSTGLLIVDAVSGSGYLDLAMRSGPEHENTT